MGDSGRLDSANSTRWQRDSTQWQRDSTQWQRDSTQWQQGQGWQQGQRWQRDHSCYRAQRAPLPAGGLPLEEAERRPGTGKSEAAWMRAREYETGKSNPDAGARFPEDQVLRLLWPYSQKKMDSAVQNKDPKQLNYWRNFKAHWKRYGATAQHKTSDKVLNYEGGYGNYFLILCGPHRWQGFSYL